MHHKIQANDVSFGAKTGAVLLEAALMQGVPFPHDCRAGRCGCCLTRVRKGITVGGEAGPSQMVYACQARVLSDLQIEFEDLPEPARVKGRVSRLAELTPDVVEVEVKTAAPLEMFPGQYCKFTFGGFPARSFSPTAPMRGKRRKSTIRLHVQRVREGRVSSQLGAAIKVGHPLVVEGPFGTAYHRTGRRERLILVSSGTGFAPIYAVADAALRENYERQIVVVAGARRIESLYMPAALGRLSAAPNVTVIAASEEAQSHSRLVHSGHVTNFLPTLSQTDIVYVAGGPQLVNDVSRRAQEASAQVHFDVFTTENADPEPGTVHRLWSKLLTWSQCQLA